jgi:glycosyltransferase involved in cell wall biosynthesis
VTRQFKQGTATFYDMAASAGDQTIHEIHDGYEVYRLSYQANMRDRLLHKYRDGQWVWGRKLLSFFELLLQNFTISVIPYRNFYTFSLELLAKDPEIKVVLASGSPYQLFYFCHKLYQKTGVPWIADYRDEWTTEPILQARSSAARILYYIDRYSEQKFLSNALDFITVSDAGRQNISRLTQLPGHVILNGFEPAEVQKKEEIKVADEFTIVFNGTLYPTQPVDFFVRPLLQWIAARPQRPRLRCRFIGIEALPEQAARVRSLISGYESFFELTNRVSKEDVLRAQHQAHLLLMIAHHQQKGIPSSKIFEYIGLGRPLLLCPSDEDILEQILSGYNLATICRSQDEVFQQIESLYRLYETGAFESSFQADASFQAGYTREGQVRRLSEVLHQVIS